MRIVSSSPLGSVVKSLLASGFCLILAAGAHALSIGEIALHSKLGEPLRASVDLKHLGTVAPGELVVGQAGEADYRTYGMQRPEFSGDLQFELVVDAGGAPRVQITTERPVGEPFVDLVLRIRWPTGHAVKQFTLLLDPPDQPVE